MKLKLNSKKMYVPFFTLVLSVLVLFPACGSDDESVPNLSAKFGYEFIDENNVRFSNQSTGEVYLLDWNFGNGRTEANSSKNLTYEVYYPQAGTYSVRLTVIDFDGNRSTINENITILNDDLVVAFTASPDQLNPNKINLTNTSEGEFDSFKWIYRNKEVNDENSTVAYFPYKGTYDIELEMLKDGVKYFIKQTFNIANDDPDYLSSFTLVWSDEFDGNEINTADWTFETGAHGWGNNELQNYTNGSNAEIEDGKLIIRAKKINDNQQPGSYTSTRMITKGKQEFTYGRMEIFAKLPSGRGIWPAIWMLGGDIGQVSWPACGEIDIMEYVGYQPNTIHATVHTPAGYGANGNGSSKSLVTAEEEFHIYGVIWTEKEMIFYTDTPENVTHTYAPSNKTDNNWPFNKPHFFILNIAVGGNWGGAQGIDNSIFPQTMEIDYVRVYQPIN